MSIKAIKDTNVAISDNISLFGPFKLKYQCFAQMTLSVILHFMFDTFIILVLAPQFSFVLKARAI